MAQVEGDAASCLPHAGTPDTKEAEEAAEAAEASKPIVTASPQTPEDGLVGWMTLSSMKAILHTGSWSCDLIVRKKGRSEVATISISPRRLY